MKKIIAAIRGFFAKLLAPEVYDPDEIALKRQALEEYCNGREWLGAACRGAFVGAAACPLYYKIPWGDGCHDTSEEVAQSYFLLYGNTDPKELKRSVTNGE